MTISSTTYRWAYSGDGSTTVFAYNNKIFADSELEVYVDAVLKTLTTDYTVSGAGNEGGGDVTFTTAPASGTSVVIIRNIPVDQETDLPAGGAFPASSVEDAFDKLTIIDQQQEETLSRAPKYAKGTTSDVSLAAPVAGKILKYNGDASKLVNTSIAELSAAGELLLLASRLPQTYDTIAEATADDDLADYIGSVVLVKEYATGQSIINATYDVVASGTGTDDGFEYHDSDTAGLFQLKLRIPSIPPLELFGCVADGDGSGGGTDNAVALQRAATWAVGQPIIGNGIYLTGKQIDFGGADIYGNWTIDGASIADSGDAADATVVNFEGGGLTQISDIDTDLNAGDQTLSFSSAHNRAVGDYICIYNPTDGSFNTSIDRYRDGEWCQVAEITDSTTLKVAWPLYADHTAATVDIYSLSSISPMFFGRLKVLAPDNAVLMNAVRFSYVTDSDISNCVALCDAGEAAIEIIQCVNITGRGVIANHHTNSTSANDYGLMIINSQRLRIEGQFTAYRHACTYGGNDIVGGVPNRDCIISGTFATLNALGGVMAVDWHGNAEHCGYEGTILGGVTLGGDHNWVRGTIHADTTGLVVYGGDLLGFDFDFQGCTFIARQDVTLAGRGSFDIGGNSATVTSTTTRGGTLDLSNTRWIMPGTSAYPIFINNNGATGTELNVNLNNAKFVETKASLTALFRVRAVSGDNFNRVSYEGITSDKDQVITIGNTTDTIVRPKKSGSVAVTVTTSVAEANQAVTFDRRYDDAPAIVGGFREQDIGTGDYVTYEIVSVTATGFTMVVHNASGSNFSANTDIDLFWIAG